MKTRLFLLVALFALLGAGQAFSQNPTGPIQIQFVNQNPNYTTSNTYFQFGGAPTGSLTANFTGTTTPVSYGTNYSFAAAASGIQLTEYSSAGRIFISLGSPLTSSTPNFQAGSGGDSNTRWDKVELFFLNGASSVVDLTAQDFFGIPLQVQTFDASGNLLGTLTWNAPTATVFQSLGSLSNFSSVAAVQSANGLPVVNDQTTPSSTLNIIRVINPSTVPAPNPYLPLSSYVQSIQTAGTVTTVSGQFDGNANTGTAGAGSPNQYLAQTYNFSATVQSNGSIQLVGTCSEISGTQTILLPAANVSSTLYTADPTTWTVNGVANTASEDTNNVYTAAMRDYIAGFNSGLVGSTATDPRTGNSYVSEATSIWYGLPKLPDANLFGYAQPNNPTYYNRFAAYVGLVSDAYGFAYTDEFQSPQLSLGSPVARMVITVLADGTSGSGGSGTSGGSSTGGSSSSGSAAALNYFVLGDAAYAFYIAAGYPASAGYYYNYYYALGYYTAQEDTDIHSAIEDYYEFIAYAELGYYSALGYTDTGGYYYFSNLAEADALLVDPFDYYVNTANALFYYYSSVGDSASADYYYYLNVGIAYYEIGDTENYDYYTALAGTAPN